MVAMKSMLIEAKRNGPGIDCVMNTLSWVSSRPATKRTLPFSVKLGTEIVREDAAVTCHTEPIGYVAVLSTEL